MHKVFLKGHAADFPHKGQITPHGEQCLALFSVALKEICQVWENNSAGVIRIISVQLPKTDVGWIIMKLQNMYSDDIWCSDLVTPYKEAQQSRERGGVDDGMMVTW